MTGKTVIDEISFDEAKNLALQDALKKAVYEAIGKNVSTENLIVNLKLSGEISGSIPYGKVIEKKILEESQIKIKNNGKSTLFEGFQVKIKAGVVEETEPEKSDFILNASLNDSVYKQGEKIQIRLQATEDCNIYIFNLLEDEKILKIIPNKYIAQNSVRANEVLFFPDKNDQQRGIELVAHLPERCNRISEAFYILALKKPYEMDITNIREGIYESYNGRASFIKKLIKEIVCVPFSKRAEVMIPYNIIDK